MRDDSDLFYGDEESAGDGAMPRLKPDWSLAAGRLDRVWG
jgi:hypothetical protein